VKDISPRHALNIIIIFIALTPRNNFLDGYSCACMSCENRLAKSPCTWSGLHLSSYWGA